MHLNLAYRWFCRLDLADRVPDHSTFSKNRHDRFRACELNRLLFEQVVAKCAAAGLVAGRDVAVDGSTIMDDASREKTLKGGRAALRRAGKHLADGPEGGAHPQTRAGTLRLRYQPAA